MQPWFAQSRYIPHRVILAHHVIFGTYGFWLPNDPRGSWSQFVASWDLYRYGPATKVNDSRSHAWDEHDVTHRREAKRALKYPPVVLSGAQALSVARGFACAARASDYRILACAILPEHVHLVLARHDYSVEQMIRRLKQLAVAQLLADHLHPFAHLRTRRNSPPSPFAAHGWKCFIDSEAYLDAAIQYVEKNPLKEGKPRQAWSFVSRPTVTRGSANRG